MTSSDDPDNDRDGPPSNTESRTDDTATPILFEFVVPADAFVLAELLRTSPDVVVEYEQLVPTNHGPLPYLWASDERPPAFRRALDDDPQVDSYETIATLDDGELYRVEWRPGDGELFPWLANSPKGVELLQGEGHDNGWRLKFRFSSRELLTGFQERYQAWDFALRVVHLHELEDPKLGQYNVTEKQREALICALRMGYFEIPREVTLGDVAEQLGISPKSVSERLRRGQTNLVSNSLTIGRPTGVGLDEQ